MSVIFQLFCAEDLQQLDDKQLDMLRETVKDALKAKTSRRGCSQELQLSLQLTPNTAPGPDMPQQVQEALDKRFHEVSDQLAALRRKAPRPVFNFAQLLSKPRQAEDPAEAKILKWAISCEINNFEFYKALLDARKAAYEWFFQQTQGKRPKGSDSPYSPFNPLHPLYSLLSDLDEPDYKLIPPELPSSEA